MQPFLVADRFNKVAEVGFGLSERPIVLLSYVMRTHHTHLIEELRHILSGKLLDTPRF